MYYTVSELHIGIDTGLQAINSNRKLNIQPYEKDWVLNEVMMQEILNIVTPKAKSGKFEDSSTRITALETLKAMFPKMLPAFKYSDSEVFAIKPSDCLYPIASKARVIPKPFAGNISITDTSATRMAYCVVPFIKSSDVSKYITDFTIKLADSDKLFDVAEKLEYNPTVNKYDFEGFAKDSTRFVLINSILESTRTDRGVDIYWEKCIDLYYPNSFIVVIDTEIFPTTTTKSGIVRAFDIATTSVTIKIDSTTLVNKFKYFDKGLIVQTDLTQKVKVVPNRFVTHSDYIKLGDNVFAHSNGDSILSVFENGIIRASHDATFAIVGIQLEYYRKPVLINSRLNIGCEIVDPVFISNLVNKTVVKLSARIADPSYPVIAHESTLLT